MNHHGLGVLVYNEPTLKVYVGVGLALHHAARLLIRR